MRTQPTSLAAKREEIVSLLSRGLITQARSCLLRLWAEHGGPALAGFVYSTQRRLTLEASVSSCRVAVLRSFTIEPLIPVLRAAAILNGIEVNVHVCPFNVFLQEVVKPTSDLYVFEPEVVFLAAQSRDVAPELWYGYGMRDADSQQAVVERVIEFFRSWLRAFRSHSQAIVVIHNMDQPIHCAKGIADVQAEMGQLSTVMEINRALVRLRQEFCGVYVLDYAGLIYRHGWGRWFDEKKWCAARMPIASGGYFHLANEWLRFLHPALGRVCKVLVTDLDNTLWGGVLGEVGIDGIQISREHPGSIFLEIQRALVDFHRKGILLAICSKNSDAEAIDVLARHPEMLLRPEHFAARRINWQDKATNLYEIAAELNMATDSLAFLDDNPAEREYVRELIPEIVVLEVGPESSSMVDALRMSPWFERLNLTREDLRRARMYSERRERDFALQHSSSLEEFYRVLEQVAQIALADWSSVARIAQMTQRTNQFNLTTRRYSEQEVSDLLAANDWDVLSLRAKDRFGEHGMVGVAFMQQVGSVCLVDTLLLSCRVIGRELESVILARLAELASERGAQRMCGWYLPTSRNAPCSGFYAKHGFQLSKQDADNTYWCLDLRIQHPAYPQYIEVEIG